MLLQYKNDEQVASVLGMRYMVRSTSLSKLSVLIVTGSIRHS